MEEYLKATPVIDCESDSVKGTAQSLTQGRERTVEKAQRLFYFVRDEIKYNPYAPLFPIQASATLKRESGFCVQKAILLTALCRAIRIPSRLGFADIRNHIIPEKLARLVGNNLFVYHGYAELYIEGEWTKATPTFDLKMCHENRIIPVEFDGKNHAMLHSHNRDGKLHIEYVCQHGHFDDVPLNEMLDAFIQVYGPELVESWKGGFTDYIGNR